MKVHLVAFPTQAQQFVSLGATMTENHLMSYAFQREADAYKPLWENCMKIFMADTSNNRGQYDLLLQEKSWNGLLSYAYRQAAVPAFSKVWELMKIYFAGCSNNKIGARDMVDDHLLSYGIPATEQEFNRAMKLHLAGHLPKKGVGEELLVESESHLGTWQDKFEMDQKEGIFTPGARVIIDSGAFTAFSTGKVIKREDYLTWATEFSSKWKDKLKSLYFMNLDVIGDAVRSQENLEWFESQGFYPIPIVTRGATKTEIKEMIAKYDYIAIGGLVGAEDGGVLGRLNVFFDMWEKERKTTGRQVKVHLLGVTIASILFRYPAYSVDSSSWTSPLRFGRSKSSGLEQVPKYTDGPGQMMATMYALRSEIQKHKDMEKQATAVWKSRGIVWDD